MGDRRAIIIGAGITGVLTARELCLAGWDVTVLEAAHVGAGSSSRTAAGIRQQFSTRETVIGMRYSVGFYDSFAEEAGERCIVQNGYLFLVDDPAAWEATRVRVAMQHDAGLSDVEMIEHDDLLKRFPFVGDELIGGTFCPTDGFLLPQVVYNEGARRARELGADVISGARVYHAEHEGDRLVRVKTTKGNFEGDLFVDCTNAWTWRTQKILGGAELPVEPLKRYLWFVQRDGAMTGEQLGNMPLTVAPGGAYCRPENRDLLLMGKRSPADADYAFSYDDQDYIEAAYSHKGGIDAVPFELWMELAEVLPPLEEFAGITATTCGYYASTPDHNPFLDFDPVIPNLVRLVGFSGHGAMFGPFTARVARELAEAGRSLEHVDVPEGRVDLDAFHIGRSFKDAERMVI